MSGLIFLAIFFGAVGLGAALGLIVLMMQDYK